MDLPLEENRGRLTYWLFYAGRCVTSAYAEALQAHCEERGKPYVVTPPQWGTLSLLLAQDGMTIGTISQKRGVDAPAATGIITRMEQIGLVERRHDREDRRVVKVYLTDEGRDIAQTLVSSVEHFEHCLKCGFSEGELDRFLAHLQQLVLTSARIEGNAGVHFSLPLTSEECSGEDTKG